jgi:glucose/mannose-6-phosphate isomerase
VTDLDQLDEAALAFADPGGMLATVASAAAQVRTSLTLAEEHGVRGLASDGRPRAIVSTGMGGSGIAGDVLAAVCGAGTPVPIVAHKSFGLPGWVGPLDLVTAVSYSGHTEETVSALEEAVRRGCPLLVVGAPDTPLHDLAERGHAVFVPVHGRMQPRAAIWSLCVPLLVAADALGLAQVGPESFEATAVALEDTARRCRPDIEVFVNPAKTLAVELDGSLPLIWGTTLATGVAAYRFACQLNENAQLAAVVGVLPEADHNQVVAFDGAGSGSAQAGDFFRDRATDAEPPPLRLVLLRDSPDEEHPGVARRAALSAELAGERGIAVTTLVAQGSSRLERLASLVGVCDWASVYLALLRDVDPTPVAAIAELKARTVLPTGA